MAGLLIWSSATMLTGMASGLVSLVALRMMLGLGESAGFPCVAKIVAGAVPIEELGFANGLVGFGYSFGPAVGAFLGGLLMARYGWRTAFVAFGAVSLVWLLPLRVAAMPGGAAGTLGETHAPPPWREVLATPALWGTALGLFCANYVFYFMLSWLPVYLVRERGFSMTEMASLTSSSYVLMAVCALLGGVGIDWVIKRGCSASLAYKGILVALHVGAVLCMVGMAYGSVSVALCGLFVYQALNGGSASALYAVPEILGGTRATGVWVGIQNSAGSLAGVAAPWITGILIEATGHFTAAFLVAAGVSFVGLAGWVGLVPRLRAIDWRIIPATDT